MANYSGLVAERRIPSAAEEQEAGIRVQAAIERQRHRCRECKAALRDGEQCGFWKRRVAADDRVVCERCAGRGRTLS